MTITINVWMKRIIIQILPSYNSSNSSTHHRIHLYIIQMNNKTSFYYIPHGLYLHLLFRNLIQHTYNTPTKISHRLSYPFISYLRRICVFIRNNNNYPTVCSAREFAKKKKRPSPISSTQYDDDHTYIRGHKTKYQIIQLIHLAPAVKEIVFLIAYPYAMHFTVKLYLLFECLLLASCFRKGATATIWSWYTTNELK